MSKEPVLGHAPWPFGLNELGILEAGAGPAVTWRRRGVGRSGWGGYDRDCAVVRGALRLRR